MEFIEIGKAMAELTTTTVIIAAVIYLLIKYFSNIIDGKIVKKEKIDEIDHLELGSLQALKQLHPYFNKVDNLIEVKLPITKAIKLLLFSTFNGNEIIAPSGKFCKAIPSVKAITCI